MSIQNNFSNNFNNIPTNFNNTSFPPQSFNMPFTGGIGAVDEFDIADGPVSTCQSGAKSAASNQPSLENVVQNLLSVMMQFLKNIFSGLGDESGNSGGSGDSSAGAPGGSCGSGGGAGGQVPAPHNAAAPHNASRANKAEGAGKVQSAGDGKCSNPALLQAINDARAQRGLKPLTEDPALTQVSRENDAANQKKGLGHHVFRRPSMGQITAMSGGGETAKGAVEQWINSPGHAKILFDPNHTKVGLSISGDFATADFS